MNKFKRIFSITLLLVLISNTLVFAAEDKSGTYATREYTISEFVQSVGRNNFSTEADLDKYSDSNKITEEYKDDVARALQKGILSGYEDNTLRMDKNIKRVEAMVILSRCLPILDESKSEIVFEDTPQWAQKDIARLTKAGILMGYGDGSFGAEAMLTVREVKMLTDRVDAIVNPVALEDDFYQYINGKTIRNNSPYAGNKVWSQLDEVDYKNKAKINNLIAGYAENINNYSSTSNEAKLGYTYKQVSDYKKRNEVGLSPFDDVIAEIDSAKDINQFIDSLIYTFNNTSVDPFFGLYVTNNTNEPEKYSLYILGPAIAISADDISDKNATNKVKQYNIFVKKIVEKLGYEDVDKAAEQIIEFENTIAKKNPNSYITSLTKYYKGYSTEELYKLLNNTGIEKMFKNADITTDEVIVVSNDAMRTVNSYFTEDNLDMLKLYTKFILVRDYSLFLDEELLNVSREYGFAVTGIENNLTNSEYNYHITRGLFPCATSEVFVENFCSASIKKDVEGMVDEIKGEFRERLKNNDWLSEETKANAIKKLDNMEMQVAYPEGLYSFSEDIDIKEFGDNATLVDLVAETNVRYLVDNFYYIDKDINKDGWIEYPTTSNAVYSPLNNCISIPAAILQEPFYSTEYSYAQNMGAIGSIIGHEITHAFDTNGSKYDENGNLKNWWGEADAKTFEGLADGVKDYFSSVEILPGKFVDGDKTVGENIADLGGVSCALEIVKAKNGNLKEFFESYATIWASNYTNNVLIEILKEDNHSPAAVRVNSIIAMFEEFYEVYGIDEEDDMYIPKEERVKVW